MVKKKFRENKIKKFKKSAQKTKYFFSTYCEKYFNSSKITKKNNDVVIPLEKEFDAQQTNDDANPLIKELFVFLD